MKPLLVLSRRLAIAENVGERLLLSIVNSVPVALVFLAGLVTSVPGKEKTMTRELVDDRLKIALVLLSTRASCALPER